MVGVSEIVGDHCEGAPVLFEDVESEEELDEGEQPDAAHQARKRRPEEDSMSGSERPPRWERPLDPDEDGDWWSDHDDDERPPSLERRRHRDPEETDERRESERRRHPRQRGGRRESDAG